MESPCHRMAPRDHRRPLGRPPTRWADSFSRSFRERSLPHWMQAARDRAVWKSCVSISRIDRAVVSSMRLYGRMEHSCGEDDSVSRGGELRLNFPRGRRAIHRWVTGFFPTGQLSTAVRKFNRMLNKSVLSSLVRNCTNCALAYIAILNHYPCSAVDR
ncbi:unnamed protein product [Heligmosomoides polygyrus]|uniref:Tnp_DDE_dom domain-containing protein n=1 Tax=Heligmosomoides polygyrus TaxID=6339 RepID=A0A183FLK4_HELPZ|nr:unnamed protein product [Heligmosomoides polygyrus]